MAVIKLFPLFTLWVNIYGFLLFWLHVQRQKDWRLTLTLSQFTPDCRSVLWQPGHQPSLWSTDSPLSLESNLCPDKGKDRPARQIHVPSFPQCWTCHVSPKLFWCHTHTHIYIWWMLNEGTIDGEVGERLLQTKLKFIPRGYRGAACGGQTTNSTQS